MTATYSVDIFCDGPDCLQWTHGHVQGGSPNLRKARQAAREAGWVRRRRDGEWVDLCRPCAAAPTPGSCQHHPDGYWIHDWPAGARACDQCYCGRSHLIMDLEPEDQPLGPQPAAPGPAGRHPQRPVPGMRAGHRPAHPHRQGDLMARPRLPAEHGTMRRWRQHIADQETPCDPCKAAKAKDMREYDASRGARTGQTGRPRTAECGTREGYNRHRRDGEDACGPCKAANTRRQQELRATRKKAAPARKAAR